MIFRACLLVVTLVLGACGPAHVQLRAPPPKDAAVEVRQAYYDAYRPVVVRKIDTLPAVMQPRRPSFLLLEDGTRVMHASDLMPLVDPTSATAVAGARSMESEGWVTTVGTAGSIAIGLGAAMMIPQAVLVLSRDDAGLVVGAAFVALACGVPLALGGLTAFVWASGTAATASEDRDAAFLAYDKSLRRRLGLDDVDANVPTQNDAGVIELHGR